MQKYISKCLKLANKNIKKEEVPVAAMIINNNKIISEAVNKKNKNNDVTSHAEIMCIKKASKKLKRWNLSDCIMIVTLKPCKMCEIIIKESRIKKVYYLLNSLDEKRGYNKTEFCEIDDCCIEKENYKKILNEFFKNKR